MKKFIIQLLLATFVSVFTASAQDNTYSMIIKMANGTVLTIGPNEVDSITFNDGQVTVAGATIKDLVSQAQDNETNIVALYAQLNEFAKLNTIISLLQQYYTKEEVSAMVSVLKTDLMSIRQRIDSLNYSHSNQLGTLQNDLNTLWSYVETLPTSSQGNGGLQSLVYVPSQDDGAIKVDGTATTKLRYRVIPTSLARVIATDVSNLRLVSNVNTDAGFSIVSALGNSTTGELELTVTPNNRFNGNRNYFFALMYGSGSTQYCTAFVPVQVTTYPTSLSLRLEGITDNDVSNVPVGAILKLIPEFVPSNTNVTDVTYTSSDETVATVDADGMVHTHKSGVVTFMATTKNRLGASIVLRVVGEGL